jgi:hypothetical protein
MRLLMRGWELLGNHPQRQDSTSLATSKAAVISIFSWLHAVDGNAMFGNFGENLQDT